MPGDSCGGNDCLRTAGAQCKCFKWIPMDSLNVWFLRKKWTCTRPYEVGICSLKPCPQSFRSCNCDVNSQVTAAVWFPAADAGAAVFVVLAVVFAGPIMILWLSGIDGTICDVRYVINPLYKTIACHPVEPNGFSQVVKSSNDSTHLRNAWFHQDPQ